MENILVCVDFSDVTSRVTEEATKLAKALDGKLHLFHAAPPEYEYVMYSPGAMAAPTAVAHDTRLEQAKLQAVADQMTATGIQAAVHVDDGPATQAILNEAERVGAEMIVMGSHGHGSLYELIVGSVTEGVLRKAKVPVMVVPSRDHS